MEKSNEKAVYFSGRTIPLHAMVASGGFAREVLASYNWDGLMRGKTEFALMQYTTGGRGKLRYEKKEYDIVPRDTMLLYFPHDNHYFLPADSPFWEFTYVCLTGNEVTRIWRDAISRKGPVQKLEENSSVIAALNDSVHRVVNETIKTPFESSALAYDLTMKLAHSAIGTTLKKQRPASIAQALDLAAVAVGAQLTVDDMAHIAGYSRYHFSRLFEASEGIAPGEFLRRQRINKAARLLQTTSAPIKQISAECGFYDATYFCKVFHKALGVSPMIFRKSRIF